MLGALALAGLVSVAGCARGEAVPPRQPATAVTAAPTAVPLELDTVQTEFGGVLRLEGARLLNPRVQQGERVDLELTWRLLRPTRRDFMVTARLVNGNGLTRARRDATIGGATSGISTWPGGGLGGTHLEVQLPALIEPGRYDLAVAVMEPTSGAQIPLSAEAGAAPVVVQSQQVLGAVRVAPNY